MPQRDHADHNLGGVSLVDGRLKLRPTSTQLHSLSYKPCFSKHPIITYHCISPCLASSYLVSSHIDRLHSPKTPSNACFSFYSWPPIGRSNHPTNHHYNFPVLPRSFSLAISVPNSTLNFFTNSSASSSSNSLLCPLPNIVKLRFLSSAVSAGRGMI